MKMLDLNKDDAELLNHVARVAKDLALTINAVVWRTLRQLRIAFLAMGSRLAKGARSTGAAMSTGLRSVRPTMARMASASARQSRKVAELTAMCAERTSVFAKPRLENAGDWTARSSRHAARALGNGLRRFAGVEPSLAAFELDRDDALLLTERGRASLRATPLPSFADFPMHRATTESEITRKTELEPSFSKMVPTPETETSGPEPESSYPEMESSYREPTRSGVVSSTGDEAEQDSTPVEQSKAG